MVVPIESISVSSARVMPKKVMNGPTGPAAVRLGVDVGLAVRVGLTLGVGLASRVGVRLGVPVGKGDAVRVGVSVDDGVGVRVGGVVKAPPVAVAVRLAAADGVAEGRAVDVTDPGEDEGEIVGVVVACNVAEGVMLRVGVRVGVVVDPPGLPVGTDVPVGDRVALGRGLELAVGVEFGVDEMVADTRVDVEVANARVAENVGLGVNVTVDVGRMVEVRVGECDGNAVTLGVNVGGIGPEFTRTMTCAIGPRFPAVSRRRTVSTVSPAANAKVLSTGIQNCTCVLFPRKLERANESRVHAALRAVATNA